MMRQSHISRNAISCVALLIDSSFAQVIGISHVNTGNCQRLARDAPMTSHSGQSVVG